MASALVLTVDDAKTDKYPPIPLTTKVKERTGNDERTRIVAIANNKKSFQMQYPYIFLTEKGSSGLIKSIIKWLISSFVCAVLIIALYPILLPVYVIIIVQWQYSTIKHRKALDYEYNGCMRVFMNVVFSLGIYSLLTLNALILGPLLYFTSLTTSKTFSFVPSILFFMFRKSVLLRLAKWHSHHYPNKSLFPQWFLYYFIQKGLRLHHILIYDWEPKNIYLTFRDKFRGKLTLKSERLPVSNFVIDVTASRVFYDFEHYMYRYVVIFAISLQLIVPFISLKSKFDLIINIFLAVGVFWIMVLIWMEIEGRIIFELLRYLDRMRQFEQLLYLDAMNKKVRTKVKRSHYLSLLNTRKRKEKMDFLVKEAPHCVDVIRLSEGDNVNIWFNNWFMLYTEANKYFIRYEYIFYSIIAAIVTSVAVIIYNFIFFQAGKREILNDNLLVSSIGCFTVFLVWIELLMISFKFSKLEKKQKTALINQKILIQETIFTNGNKQDIDGMDVVRLKQCVKLMDDLMKKMEMNGLSPKIAGIAMNQAFVRITLSLIISVITAGLSFYLKNS